MPKHSNKPKHPNKKTHPRTVTIKLPYLTFRKLYQHKENIGFGDKSLEDFFQYLTQGINLTPTISEHCQQTTRRDCLPMWMRSFADNLPYIRWGDNITLEIPEGSRGRSITELAAEMPILEFEGAFPLTEAPVEEFNGVKVKNPPAGSAIVIGRGPDVWKHKHLEMLADAINSGRYKGLVCATDGMLIECLKRGIIPDVTLSVDGSPIIQKWYDDPLVRKYGEKLKIILLVSIDHKVYQICRKAGCKVYWAMPLWDDYREAESFTRIQRLMTTTKEGENGLPASMSGGNAGTMLWAMASDLFKRAPVGLIGFDMGYPEGTPLGQTSYYSAVSAEYSKGGRPLSKLIPVAFQEVYHPIFKTKAFFDAVFFGYRESFIELQQNTRPWFRHCGGTYNCTEGGTLFGEGVTCIPFADFLKKFPK